MWCRWLVNRGRAFQKSDKAQDKMRAQRGLSDPALFFPTQLVKIRWPAAGAE